MLLRLLLFVGQSIPLDDPPLLREYFSFDWDDLLALGTAIAALITALSLLIKKRSETSSKMIELSRVEEIDAGVLGKFTELFDRITQLEKDLAETRVELRTALGEIAEMHKLEEFLQARLHEKDSEIKEMKDGHAADILRKQTELDALTLALGAAQQRISKLEEVLRDQGYNLKENGF